MHHRLRTCSVELLTKPVALWEEGAVIACYTNVSQLQVDGLTQKDGSQVFKFIFKPVSLNGFR